MAKETYYYGKRDLIPVTELPAAHSKDDKACLPPPPKRTRTQVRTRILSALARCDSGVAHVAIEYMYLSCRTGAGTGGSNFGTEGGMEGGNQRGTEGRTAQGPRQADGRKRVCEYGGEGTREEEGLERESLWASGRVGGKG